METCYHCNAIIVGRQIEHTGELNILILERHYLNVYGNEGKVKEWTTPLHCHKPLNSGAGVSDRRIGKSDTTMMLSWVILLVLAGKLCLIFSRVIAIECSRWIIQVLQNRIVLKNYRAWLKLNLCILCIFN